MVTVVVVVAVVVATVVAVFVAAVTCRSRAPHVVATKKTNKIRSSSSSTGAVLVLGLGVVAGCTAIPVRLSPTAVIKAVVNKSCHS